MIWLNTLGTAITIAYIGRWWWHRRDNGQVSHTVLPSEDGFHDDACPHGCGGRT